MIISIRLALLFVFVVTKSFAQGYNFNHYQNDQGLSNNSVLCSAQDADGFLWFGTRDGLNRFDGYTFKHFPISPTTANTGGSNFIRKLLVLKNRSIWVATDQGIYLFDPYKERFTFFRDTIRGEILHVKQSPDGTVWFICNHLLYRYWPDQDRLVHVTLPGLISALEIDQRNNDVWIGTTDGHIQNIRTKQRYAILIDKNFPEPWIECLYQDEAHNLWIGTAQQGLQCLTPAAKHVTSQIKQVDRGLPLFVRDILSFDHDQLWIASESGLLIYHKTNKAWITIKHEKDNPWSISDNAIYTLCKDHRGGIWVGSYFGGVNYFHPMHNAFHKIFPRYDGSSIAGAATREVLTDQAGNLWIGTEDKGLSKWNPKTNTFTNFGLDEGLAHTNIHGLLAVGDQLLISTFNRGLDIMNMRTNRIVKHYDLQEVNNKLGSNFVYTMYRTRDGEILLATGRGLVTYYPKASVPFSKIDAVPGHIFYTAIFEDRDGLIWLGTWRDGLYCYDRKNRTVKLYEYHPDKPSLIQSNRVNRVYQAKNGEIWVATENGIAVVDKKTQRSRRISTSDGLPSNLILAFIEDDQNNMWVSTSKGLVAIAPNGKIQLFDKEMGLLDVQFNYNAAFRAADGFFYFGSIKGLIGFRPQELTGLAQDKTSPLRITSIHIHHNELSPNDEKAILDTAITYVKEITLQYNESTIGFDFSCFDFVAPQSNRYLYKLDGYDKDWTRSEAGHSAYFTKIPPGEYVFMVKVADINGKSLSNVRSLKIRIKPPFWATPVAYLIYVALLVLLISYIIYAYDHRIKEKNRRRLEKIRIHREQELYRAKMDFFTRITHDIKTPLTLIKAPLERLRKHVGESTKGDQLIKLMENNTEKLLSLTDKLLDFRKVESNHYQLQCQQCDVATLLQQCIQDHEPLIEQRGLNLYTDIQQPLFAKADVEVLFKIFENLVSNAVKYAATQVTIQLTTTSEQHLRLCIKNDGQGLLPNDVKQLFEPFHRASHHYRVEGSGLGLALAQSFAQLHGGSLIFLENSENLNIFVLEVPIMSEYV